MQILQLELPIAVLSPGSSSLVRADNTQNLLLQGHGESIDGLILLGDAFDLFDLLPSSSVDLIITSPPYWGHRAYDLDHNWPLFNELARVRQLPSNTGGYQWYREEGGVLGLEPYPEWYVTHIVEILDKAKRVLRKSGSLWLNIGDTYFARWSSIRESGRQGLADSGRLRRRTPMGGIRQEKQLLLIPSRVAIGLQDSGWILRNDVIWHKPNAAPRPEGDRLKLAHEHFFHFVHRATNGRPKYYYDLAGAEPRKNDVVTVNVEPGEADHTATFPESLVGPRIKSSCPPGGLVLDPFCGTGRALQVAKRLGRRVIGFDAQRRYCELSLKKLAAHVQEK